MASTRVGVSGYRLRITVATLLRLRRALYAALRMYAATHNSDPSNRATVISYLRLSPQVPFP